MYSYALVLFNGRLYRPAGFRFPKTGELYLSSTGRVVAKEDGALLGTAPKNILREIPQSVLDSVRGALEEDE